MIPPVENSELYGHEVVEAQLLKLLEQQTLPHAMLITGAQGIGKATLAFRLARFVLSGAKVEPASMGLFGEEPATNSLKVAMEIPSVQRMIIGSHGDLLVIQPEFDEKKKTSVDTIFVERIRKVVEFMHHTPSESEWRVVIIDPAEAMNVNAANALLKVLEEPPKQTLLLLISHQPGRLLPTIRSRCRLLEMRAPSLEAVESIFAQQQLSLPAAQRQALTVLANGSPGLAMRYAEHEALMLYQRVIEVMVGQDVKLVQSLAAEMGKQVGEGWYVAKSMLLMALYRIVCAANGLQTGHNADNTNVLFDGEHELLHTLLARQGLAYWLELWEKAEQSLQEVTTLTMDKKQTVMQLLFACMPQQQKVG